MRGKTVSYIALLIVALISFLAALLLPINEFAKTITALPFVGSLFVALFQIIRDHTSFIKDKFLQEREHAFIVAATSHMSKVVFDKHVDFSEEYITELQKILGNLVAEGPSKNAVNYVSSLYEVRRKYRLWISPKIANKLDEFENKMSKMGASYGLWESTQNRKGSNEVLQQAYKLFNEVMELKKENPENPDIEIKKHEGYNLVIEHLQNILGIEKLTSLRDSIIDASNLK